MNAGRHYDCIIVGAGLSGLTLARELSRSGIRVLILDKGGAAPKRESLLEYARISRQVRVCDKVDAVHVTTTGGASTMYFAVAELPPVELFRGLAIELGDVAEEVCRELPLTTLEDHWLCPQTLRVHASAQALGYQWKRNPMLVDLGRVHGGDLYGAKWRPDGFLRDALAAGAVYRSSAEVKKILVQDGRAVGVELKKTFGRGARLFADKVVLCTGPLATPGILRDTGLTGVARRGYQCYPTFTLFAHSAHKDAQPHFVGCMSGDLGDGIHLGDANVPPVFYRMMMLDNRKIFRLFDFSKSMAVAVKVRDQLDGQFTDDGRFRKTLDAATEAKLASAESHAREILEHAGGRAIFRTKRFSATMSGLVRIQDDVDSGFETTIRNLHVCDASLMPPDCGFPPSVTLVCLAKYLARALTRGSVKSHGQTVAVAPAAAVPATVSQL